ncbi:hypothetical protein OB905_11115 [Halobacteria archaeon AArc-dxtr1]|nr:hypothetical protein [Halobacteria archaeon AArc-dxtr1]
MNERERYDGRLDQRLFEVLEGEGGCERVSSVITADVPNRLPGQLLLEIADLTDRQVATETALDAAVAVELAWLHQYLHAIPRVKGALDAPAAQSPYDGNTIAAILDGDLLQAQAFARLSAAVEEPETTSRCCRHLSRASIHSYERLAENEGGPDATTFAPITGVAARIGAVLGGADRPVAASIERSARATAAATPVRTPQHNLRTYSSRGVDDAVEELLDVIGATDVERARIDGIVSRTRSAVREPEP